MIGALTCSLAWSGLPVNDRRGPVAWPRSRTLGNHRSAVACRSPEAETAHLSATRAGYDAVAEQYAELFCAALDETPLDRALLRGFAELVRRDHPAPEVLEVGSGPGNVAAYLHQLGMTVCGIDLSPAMVELARREHPEVRFEVGEMGALEVADASLAGVVAWYSVIHVPRPNGRE